MTEYGFWSLIPPLFTILLAVWTRQVIFSLLLGVFIGRIIIGQGNIFEGFLSSFESIVDVFKSPGNTRTILFTLFIGALIRLIRHSNGINGFVHIVHKKINKTKHPKRSIQLAASISGFLLFIEANISILTVGTAFKPLFDKYKLAKEKLAYLADSSSAPSCILFPFNAWGAYIMGLLLSYEYIDPFKALLLSIPFNFYAILSLLMVFYLILSGKNYGSMKVFEQHALNKKDTTNTPNPKPGQAYLMIAPILVMVLSMPLFLIVTGWNSTLSGSFVEKIRHAISHGSGSSAVLYSVAFALLFAGLLYGFKKIITVDSFFKESILGMHETFSMAAVMTLAFGIGSLCKELETGLYITEVTSAWLSPTFLPMVLFITSCFTAFFTGTSWGTYAIMISIAMPLANTAGVNPYLVLGAVLGGGVFGDHCSPISDTTIIASMATKCKHIDHVKTQLPYALFVGSIAAILYLMAGLIL